jgi:hypothetical protein
VGELVTRRELRARNRRIVAERVGWPDGAVEACERLEREYRGWDVRWLDDWFVKGFERQAGYYAWATGEQPGTSIWVEGEQIWIRRQELYGMQPSDLEKQLP